MHRLIKDALASAAGGGAARALAAALARFDDDRPNVVRVLTYHRVDRPGARPTLNPRLISATPEGFAAQMAMLAARHPVVALADVLATVRGAAALPARAVLVTFDDACLDFAEHAWPAMRRLGLPATVFVPTAYPDDPRRAFWWDRLYHALWHGRFPGGLDAGGRRWPLAGEDDRRRAYDHLGRQVKALPHAAAMDLVDRVCAAAGLDGQGPEPAVMGWPALRSLAAEGVALAPHTRTHPLLQRVGAAEAEAEIAGSLADLAREVGAAPPALAYPDGGHDAGTLAAARSAGIEVAFTTRSGVNRLDGLDAPGRLRLRRINVGRRVTPAVLRARLVAWPLRHAG